MADDLAAKITQLEALRPTFGDAWVDAQVAALRSAEPLPPPLPPDTAQTMEAGGDIVNSTQIVGDANVVLREIAVADGGTLIVSAAPSDLPPQPEAIQRALTTYLETLLERYQFLSLQGLGASKAQQARVALRAVFINLRTSVQVTAFAQLPSVAFGDVIATMLHIVSPSLK